jgi:RNase P protein component
MQKLHASVAKLVNDLLRERLLRICVDPAKYPHTRVGIEIDRAAARAVQRNSFLEQFYSICSG